VQKRYDVTIASPEGGKVEVDSLSDPRDDSKLSADDLTSVGALNTPAILAQLGLFRIFQQFAQANITRPNGRMNWEKQVQRRRSRISAAAAATDLGRVTRHVPRMAGVS
jgi:hypothetical protein